MTTQKMRLFAINEQQLAILQEFIGTLPLTWKQTNPVMQLLVALPEIKSAPPELPKNQEKDPPPKF